MTKNLTEELAKKIVYNILKDLKGRQSIGDVLESIDKDVYEFELIPELVEVVYKTIQYES